MNIADNPFRTSAGSIEFFATLRTILLGEYKNWTLETLGVQRDGQLCIVPNSRTILADLSGTLLALVAYDWAIVEHMLCARQEASDYADDQRKLESVRSRLVLLRLKREALQRLILVVVKQRYPQVMKPGQACAPVIYSCFFTRLKGVDFEPESFNETQKATQFLRQFMVELVRALGPDVYVDPTVLDRKDLEAPCTCMEKGCMGHDLLDVREDEHLAAFLSIIFAQTDALKSEDSESMRMHRSYAAMCARLFMRYRALVLKPDWYQGVDCAILSGPKLGNIPSATQLGFARFVFLDPNSGPGEGPSNKG